MIALGTLVPEAVAPVLKERGIASAAVLMGWAEIVGPRLARWTCPVEIRWPRRPEDAEAAERRKDAMPRRPRGNAVERATLVVACPGAFALDLQMASAGVIEAVNRRLGYACIGRVEVRQVPRPAAPRPAQRPEIDPAVVSRLETEMEDIEAEGLRKALARLGAGIAARESR